MKEKIRVMIADTDTELSENLRNYLNECPEMEVVGSFKDGHSVVNSIKELMPDILLMDLILPKMDGLDVLASIRKLPQSPEVIITSLLDHSNMIGCALASGAAYYICKPYSLSNVYERILQVCNFRNSCLITECPKPVPVKKGEFERRIKYQKPLSLEAEVTAMIRELGIPAHIKGYQYIRDGIIFALGDANMLNYITKFLYPTIAKKYKTTSSSVERAIRHAIGVAWERGNTEALEQLYGYSLSEKHVRPTNSEFLAIIVDKLRLDYKQNA